MLEEMIRRQESKGLDVSGTVLPPVDLLKKSPAPFSENERSILKLLAEDPAELRNVRYIATKLDLNGNSVHRVLRLLEKAALVDKEMKVVLGSEQKKVRISAVGLAVVQRGFDEPSESTGRERTGGTE